MMTRPRSILSIASFALTLGLGAAALAGPPSPAPSPLGQSVRTLLSGYEQVPTAADWARLGTPEAVAGELVAVADDARPDRRVMAARAMASLGHFPLASVRAYLEGRVRDPATRAQLRGKAAIALAGAFGDSAAKVIATLFTSADPDVREDAIRAWRRLVSPAAERFAVARAGKEPVLRLAELMRDAGRDIARERQRLKDDRRFDPALEQVPDLVDPGPVALP